MVAIGQADSSRSTLYFLDRDHMVEIAEPQPAPFLFDGDAVEAKRAHRGPQLVAREPVVGICFGGERGDLFDSESGGGLADHLGALAESEIAIGISAHNQPLDRTSVV